MSSDLAAPPDPTTSPETDAASIRGQKIQDAIAYIKASGRNTRLLPWLERQANRIGRRTDQTFTGLDFNDPTFDQTRAQNVRGVLNRAKARTGGGANIIRPGAFGKGIDTLRNQADVTQSTNDWATYGEPAFDEASNQIDQLINTPLFSASFIQNARSNIARIIKGDEERRLKMVSAGLGISGMDPSTPAGAFMAHKAAISADAELANSLRDFGMTTEQAQRTSMERELGLKADLVAKRFATKQGFLSADKERMYQLSDQVSSILEALRQTQEMEALQAEIARNAASRDWVGTGLQAMNAAGTMAAGMGAFGGGPTAGGGAPVSPTGNWAGVSSVQSPAYRYPVPDWSYSR